MALSTTAVIYIVFGGISVFGLGLVILVVSGKSIFFDFYRRMFPKGCDVYIINGNRQLSHFYRIPKDGVFRIAKKMYITNPDKIMSLSDDMKKEIAEKIVKKEKSFDKRIKEFEVKRKTAEEILAKL